MSDVPRPPLPAFRAGVAAAAVAAGVIVGAGWRSGVALTPFEVVGHRIAAAPRALEIALGVAVHTAGYLALGVVVAVAAGGRAWPRRLLSATLVTVIWWLWGRTAAPGWRPDVAAGFALPQEVLLGVLTVAALVAGSARG
jgi:hypothetical protein